MARTVERYSWSFLDALSLARNSRDQATIYYSKDGVRAVYDATGRSEGTLFVCGKQITARDLSYEMRPFYSGGGDDGCIVAGNAITARKIFEHNGVSTDTGWDLRP